MADWTLGRIAELERDLAQRQKEYKELSDVNDELQQHIRTLREALTIAHGWMWLANDMSSDRVDEYHEALSHVATALEATKEIG